MILPFLCFANSGKLLSPYYLENIKTSDGTIIYQATPPASRQALPGKEANLMNNMLTAVINEGTGKRLRTTYGLRNELAGKTGTTQNQVDGWFVGYHPHLVVGIRAVSYTHLRAHET